MCRTRRCNTNTYKKRSEIPRLRREPTAVIPPLRQRRDRRRSMLRVSSVHAARLTRLGAVRVRLGSLGNLGKANRDKPSSPDNAANRASRTGKANRDKPSSPDNAANRASQTGKANRDKPSSRDNAANRASRTSKANRDKPSTPDNAASRDKRARASSQANRDKPSSRDNAANRDKRARASSQANREKPSSRDKVVSLANPMDLCERRGNLPVRLALRDSPVNRVRPTRQRPRSRSVLTLPTKKGRASATNRLPLQFRLNKRPSQCSAAVVSRAVMIDRLHHRQIDEAHGRPAVEYLNGRFLVVAGLGEEDVVHVGLRVPVVQRKPARLHLHHDAVSRQEHMIGGRQRETKDLPLIRGDRLRIAERIAVAAAKDVG